MSAHPHTRPPTVRGGNEALRPFAAFVAVLAVVGVLLVVGALVQGPSPGGADVPGGAAGASGSPGVALDPSAYIDPEAPMAPALELVDTESRPFTLASQLGHPVLVFFGYTHCPDVCPTTIGAVGRVLREVGWGTTAVFASIDPERDTPEWLKDWTEFLPDGFKAVTGTPEQVKEAADDWGVKYARVDTEGSADAYSMAHTADVYLIDAAGRLRATFPYGTEAETMVAVLREVARTPGAAASTAPGTPSAPAATVAAGTPAPSAIPLGVEVLTTSVWAGGSPVILGLSSEGARVADEELAPTVQLTTPDGEPIGSPVTAVAVRPKGVDDVSYVATIDVPTAGSWRLEVEADLEAGQAFGSTALEVLDPGSTAKIGGQAPTIRTPTLDDVGGDARRVTTDPAPDLRLSQRSTADALAEGKPFILVLDSNRFKVSPACGRAIILVRYLLDRWTDVDFIHHEPYRYSIVTETPVMDGDLQNPVLTDASEAWGIGAEPWGAKTMPWIFIVDGARGRACQVPGRRGHRRGRRHPLAHRPGGLTRAWAWRPRGRVMVEASCAGWRERRAGQGRGRSTTSCLTVR